MIKSCAYVFCAICYLNAADASTNTGKSRLSWLLDSHGNSQEVSSYSVNTGTNAAGVSTTSEDTTDGNRLHTLVVRVSTQCDQMSLQLRSFEKLVQEDVVNAIKALDSKVDSFIHAVTDKFVALDTKVETLTAQVDSLHRAMHVDASVPVSLQGSMLSERSTPLSTRPISKLDEALQAADAIVVNSSFSLSEAEQEALDNPRKLTNSKKDKAERAVIFDLTKDNLVSRGADASTLETIHQKLKAWVKVYPATKDVIATFEVESKEPSVVNVQQDKEQAQQPPAKRTKKGGKRK
ncbi:MAG: hypothetical protein K6C34_05810 [Alphaproteobacteria bacterium]|nr:hypothetical protein [Alphaproteobacteria bacterium]